MQAPRFQEISGKKVRCGTVLLYAEMVPCDVAQHYLTREATGIRKLGVFRACDLPKFVGWLCY